MWGSIGCMSWPSSSRLIPRRAVSASSSACIRDGAVVVALHRSRLTWVSTSRRWRSPSPLGWSGRRTKQLDLPPIDRGRRTCFLVRLLIGTGMAARLRDIPPRRGSALYDSAATPWGRDRWRARTQEAARLQRSTSPTGRAAQRIAVGRVALWRRVRVPSAYYLAATAAILKSGVGSAAQIGALLVLNVVAFSVAGIRW